MLECACPRDCCSFVLTNMSNKSVSTTWQLAVSRSQFTSFRVPRHRALIKVPGST